MTFSEIFKTQRNINGYTQEEIADILKVTPQAVSKWETGSGMPDISLIVPIARLFQITTDRLLGNDYKDEETIRDELHEASITITEPNERYEKYQSMLKYYPRSADVYARLINCIAEIIYKYKKKLNPERINELVNEAERYSIQMREVSDNCGADFTYSHAFLADVYLEAGEFEKAEKEMNFLPYCRYTKPRMLGNIRFAEEHWDNALELYQESLSDGLRWFFYDVFRLAKCHWKLTGDNSNSMKIFKLAYDLIHLIYRDNKYPIPLNIRLIEANRQLAAHMVRVGDDENAYRHLEEMILLAEEHQKNYGKNFETGCILFPKAMPPYDSNNINKEKKISVKNQIINAMTNWNAFDRIRNEERFGELLKRAGKLE